MRLINIYAAKDALTTDTHFAGYCGEERGAQLVIRLGEGMNEGFDYYLRFCTSEQAQRGGMSVTEKLIPREELYFLLCLRVLCAQVFCGCSLWRQRTDTLCTCLSYGADLR